MADRKLDDDTHRIADKRGNGLLRREIWVDAQGRVTRYNLASINQGLFGGDHGRVVSYDNAHDGHRRHFLGAWSLWCSCRSTTSRRALSRTGRH